MAKTIHNYSADEYVNKSMALGLQNFSQSLSSLSDYGDLLVQNLDLKSKYMNTFLTISIIYIIKL